MNTNREKWGFSLSISDAVQMHQIKLFSPCSLLLINCIHQSVLKSQANVLISADLRLAPLWFHGTHRVLSWPWSDLTPLLTWVLVTNVPPLTRTPALHLIWHYYLQPNTIKIAGPLLHSTVNYDFVAATVYTGKCTNIPPDILISLIFTKILGHLTLTS